MTGAAADWAPLRGRHVLVTGASGFTGRHLAKALVEAGCRVRALLRRPADAADLAAAGVELVEGDLRDASRVDAAVEGCDQVYHVAALYRDASAKRQDYWDVNVTGTEHVLSACERRRVKRLIHCSTCGVHGNVQRIPSDEEAPFRPDDDYQRSKLAAEQRVRQWSRDSGIATAVVRPCGIYGPGDLRFLKLFRSIQRGVFVMLGSGQTYFHAVYIDDLIQGMLRCGISENAAGEAFLICSGEPLRLNAFVALIAEVLGVQPPRWRLPVWPVYAVAAACEAVCVPLRVNPPLHRRRVGFFTHNRAFTSAKAQRLLGYTSAVSLREGLARTARWYRQQGYLPAG